MSAPVPRREALREKFLQSSRGELSERELLDLLLGFVLSEDGTDETADALLARFGSLSGVLNAGDLTGEGGLPDTAAGFLRLAGVLIRRSFEGIDGLPVISGPDRAGEYLVPRLLGLNREMMYALCLDSRLRLLSCRAVCDGGLSRLIVDTYALLGEALERGSEAVIIAHNHPNGIALPSQADRSTTDHLADLLAKCGIVLLDHLVVAGADFVSMACEHSFTAPPSPLRNLYSA